MKKFLEIIKNKWLIKGTTTLLLIAIIIACYVLINWGVDKIKVEDIDVTTKKLYSLSDETKNRLTKLDRDVTLQLINMTSSTYVIDYAEKYENASKRITVENIDDLSSRVDLQTKYNITSTGSLIVIKSGEKEKTLTTSDLYTYDYSNSKQIDKTEEAFTNAIVEVTTDERPHIYILSGKSYYNTEQALSTVIQELKDEANDVDYLDILTTGSIPEDCKCLVITTLNKDLDDIEKDKIIEYINNGGKLMIMSSQNMLEFETPNFNQVLAQYGIKIGYGVIFEQDGSKMLQNSPDMIIENVSANFMSSLDMSLKACFIDAGKIEFEDADTLSDLGVEYETIASTSDKAFVRTKFDAKTTSRTENDGEEGSAIIGAYVNKKISDEKNSQLIIYSNEIFATNLTLQISAYYTYASELYNNKDVILNSISHLTEREDTITIRKTNETEKYTVTDQEDVIIKTIIFVVPILTIFTGIVVWIFRRRKM